MTLNDALTLLAKRQETRTTDEVLAMFAARDVLIAAALEGDLVTKDAVARALDLALEHFPERLDRAFGLIRVQAEQLGIALPERFGEVVRKEKK